MSNSSIWHIDMILSGATTPGSEWTWERWQWRDTPHSPKLQDWSLTFRFFSAISKIGRVLLFCRGAVGVSSWLDQSESRRRNMKFETLQWKFYILWIHAPYYIWGAGGRHQWCILLRSMERIISFNIILPSPSRPKQRRSVSDTPSNFLTLEDTWL